jgi:hypothetical protein
LSKLHASPFRRQKACARSTVIGSLIVAVLFVAASAAGWLLSNSFVIAREEGFDPFRYEYLARSDLPEYLADSSSYTIVLLLKFLYQFLPEYFGFIALVAVCLTIVLATDRDQLFRAATLSPLAFFYFGQTGKDGLAILAFAAVALLACYGLRARAVPLLLIIALALFIRPALLLLLPPLFILFRFGVRWSLLTSVSLSATFLLTTDAEATLAIVEGVVSDDGSGPLAQFGRELTFGYTVVPIIGRCVLLLISPFIQPLGSTIKALSSGEPFVFFEGACQAAFLIVLIKTRMVGRFLKYSLPFVVAIAAASPFYHFRYMAVTYPAILAYCLWHRSGRGLARHRRIAATAPASRRPALSQ